MTIYIKPLKSIRGSTCYLCGKKGAGTIQSDKNLNTFGFGFSLCTKHADELAKGKIEDLRK